MGTCKYCGQGAGIFSHVHAKCEAKHSNGVTQLTTLLQAYFAGQATAADIATTTRLLQRDAFLNEDDICDCAAAAIRAYTASIHRPFSPTSMHLVDDLLKALAVPYSHINRDGAVDEFTSKLMKGFMVEYFTGKLTLSKAHARCQKVLARFPMAQSGIEDTYLYVLNKAAINFLKDGFLSDDEQQKIDEYVQHLALPVNNLPAQYKDSEISKLGQVTILKDIQRGVVPHTNVVAPIILGKKESVLWAYHDVNLYQEKIQREWVGRSGGFSFRIMKGVYYRVGGMKGHPVEHSSMELQGTGTLYITNKNLIFHSTSKGVKIPFNKMVGINPYADGIEVLKDGANAKRLALQGFDPWFLMNLLSQVSSL